MLRAQNSGPCSQVPGTNDTPSCCAAPLRSSSSDDGVGAVSAGVALWGLHMGLTQGILASLVADTAPADLRGTAFGLFNLITGLATLLASVIAGVLWDVAGPATTFLAGAMFTGLALCVVPVIYRMIDAR